MRNFAVGAVIWTVGAVSASAAPQGFRIMTGDGDFAALTVSATLDAAAAQPLWGIAIAGFGILGGWLREIRKQRVALAYR